MGSLDFLMERLVAMAAVAVTVHLLSGTDFN